VTTRVALNFQITHSFTQGKSTSKYTTISSEGGRSIEVEIIYCNTEDNYSYIFTIGLFTEKKMRNLECIAMKESK
jgi:hypothetical protein